MITGQSNWDESVYGEEPKPLQDNEIRPANHLLQHAPDLHALAGPTYHQGADYGQPEIDVTVVDGCQCVHDGLTYGGGETVRVPRAVADYWVRSGWATTESDAEPVEPAADEVEPAKVPAKAAARRQVSAGSGRRTPKR